MPAVRIGYLSLFLCLYFLNWSVVLKFAAHMSSFDFWFVCANAISLLHKLGKICIEPFCTELYRLRKGSGSFPSKNLKLTVGNTDNSEKELV